MMALILAAPELAQVLVALSALLVLLGLLYFAFRVTRCLLKLLFLLAALLVILAAWWWLQGGAAGSPI